MRLRTLIMMAATIGSREAQASGTEAQRVTVCMSAYSAMSPSYETERAVSAIFFTIGVRIDWHDNSCPASPDVIKISYADDAPKRISPGALAFALPYEGTHIVVLYRRMKQQSGIAERLLPFVLVHEITHILEASSEHSETGIMKACWNSTDYYHMLRHTLAFAAEDVASIHRGIDWRAARAAGQGAVQVAVR
jgi:hypothetical protein